MTAQRTEEDGTEFLALARGIEVWYSKLAEMISSPDFGLDMFYLEALHAHAGSIHERILRVARLVSQEREPVIDSLFALQWSLSYTRRLVLRPLTLRFAYLVSEFVGSLSDLAPNPVGRAAFEEPNNLARRVEEKLSLFSARNPRDKAAGVALLGGICERARYEVEALAGSIDSPPAHLRALTSVAERMGWWVDEVYSWLRPLALKLIHERGGTSDDVILMGIKMKAEEWQRAKIRVEALSENTNRA